MSKNNKQKLNFKKKIIYLGLLTVLLITLAIYIVFFIILKDKDSELNDGEYNTKTVSRVEGKTQKAVEQKLKDNDYEGYQSLQLRYVQGYINVKDYKNASRLLKEITDNVPSGRIMTLTYQCLSDVARETDDKENYRKYTQKLIEELRKDGNNQGADYYAKQLKEI